MENLLKLCLILLYFENALTLQCVLCLSYKNGECVNGNQTCTTQPGEVCMIRRTWNSFEYDKLKSAELRCTESCKFDETTSGSETILTYCCNYEDFCNSIDLPM
ncbi:hypothetical protein A6R68_09883, partial [Neotoma lepida]